MSDRFKRHKYTIFWLTVSLVVIPLLYLFGLISIETVNRLGRFTCFAIVAVGLDLVWGYTGMLSLCQALFFAVGGYAMGMYLGHHGGAGGALGAHGWDIPACLYVVYPYKVGQAPADAVLPWFWKPFYNLPITLLLGVIVPGVVAGLIGYFGFRSRVRGVYFAILTQAIAVAAWLFFCMNNMMFCGTNGLTNFDKLAGLSLAENATKLGLYMVSVLALFGVYLLCRFITKTQMGRVLIAIRDDEKTLRFSGYRPHDYKVFVFVVAAMIAGLGGMLYTPQMGIITPSNMEAAASILVVIWVAVGGRGTLSGAIVGAYVVNMIYNYLTSTAPELWPYLQGGLFIAVVLFFPKGLMGLVHQGREFLLRKWKSRPGAPIDNVEKAVKV